MATIPGDNVTASEFHWFTRDIWATIRKGPWIFYASRRESWFRKPWIGSFPLSLKTNKRAIHEVINKTSQGFTLTF